jgi:hypothetical protein
MFENPITDPANYITVATSLPNGNLRFHLICRSCQNSGGLVSLQHISSCTVARGPLCVNYSVNPQNLNVTLTVQSGQIRSSRIYRSIHQNP